MTSMTPIPAHRRVVIGVDTHKYLHVSVALDDIGATLDARASGADRAGYDHLPDWKARRDADLHDRGHRV